MPSSLAEHYGADATTQVAPSMMVGNKWVWDRTDTIPDHLLPLNGQTVAAVDVDYPELWSVRALTTLIASFDDIAKTITLQDYNGEGRFFRAGPTPGVLQTDATAVNGLRLQTSHVQWDWTANDFNRVSRGANSQLASNQGFSSLDPETRPINVSEVACIIAKPWVVAGDVTINVGGVQAVAVDPTVTDGSRLTLDTSLTPPVLREAPAIVMPVQVDATIPDNSLLILDTGTAPPTLREAPANAATANMERAAGTVNRDFAITLGPFQFRVPTSGINSLQHRYIGGGTTTIERMQQWAHAGGLRNSFGGVTSGSGFQYFSNEWNMTAINQMHFVEFENGGWFYELNFIVRDSFIQNPYSYKRTRM